MVLIAGECLDNRIQQSGSDQVTPQQVEQNKGKCTDEQVDPPVFRVELQHAELEDTGLL
jgi:hypothetical protein